MATTKDDIRGWLQDGKDRGATHMVVCCDTFDWSDYPVYVFSEEAARNAAQHSGEMQKIMEVYKLDLDWDAQLSERGAHHY